MTLVSLTLAVSAAQSTESTTRSNTTEGSPAETACMPPFGEGFTSEFAHVNGLWIHYWIGGSGTPLLLIHGYPENGYAWHAVAPVLARTHTVIVPDFRGAGESSKPPEGYTTAALADDLYKLVRSLGYRKVAIAGHDWGGRLRSRTRWHTEATSSDTRTSKLAHQQALVRRQPRMPTRSCSGSFGLPDRTMPRL